VSLRAGVAYKFPDGADTVIRFYEASDKSVMNNLRTVVVQMDAKHVGCKMQYFTGERAEGAPSPHVPR
jgi:hypothetical protein